MLAMGAFCTFAPPVKRNEFISLFASDPRLQELQAAFHSAGIQHIQCKGFTGSSAACMIARQFQDAGGVQLILMPDKEAAAYRFNDLEQLLGEATLKPEEKRVLFFPSSFKTSASREIKDNQGLLLRTEVVHQLHQRPEFLLIVTYPDAICEKVVDKTYYEQHTLTLHQQERITLDFFLEVLLDYGFVRTDFVIEPGQFSLRGGLIDVFSFGGDHPYRVEFLGDQVGSLRSFDPATQRSLETFREITIIPDIRDQEDDPDAFVPVSRLLPEKTIWWTHELPEILEGTPDEEITAILDPFLVVECGPRTHFEPDKTIHFHTAPQPSVSKNFNLLLSHLGQLHQDGYRSYLLSDNPRQQERLNSIIQDIREKEIGKNVPEADREVLYQPLPVTLHEGFIDHDQKLAFFTDHQIFERYHRFRLRDGYAGKEALTLRELYDLKPGDFVTHIDHGVGRFDGLEKIINDGKEQEAIRLMYKNGDILYVSIHSLHRITKYTGKEGTEPRLNRLGSDAWNRLKAKTKKRVKDIAKELIALYARRKASEGHACMPDTYLQTELEASFIYEDTPDQVKATRDVKKDMESSWPMDRLICGDVGFGKTEIAIRAAFKMVTESRQVAILVPTTILALQHYKTFSDRLAGFPCTIRYINRFKSAAAQKQILQEVAEGKVDILIGTHRMLSKDVNFKDLGLLIIDEEQKFGVAAKEKIKRFKVNVDTLTLTATPIPRTLQFSLMGARDLSIINTPPPNRYPVQTEIHAYHEELIRDAIEYEVARGGQVFLVNTRVQNIEEVAGMVRRAVPHVRVAVAHGQMEGKVLERVMLDFIEGLYDVLVSTTIIESGLDIPNVNTMIINDAHHYGLSDLHQLRGRVGRTNKKAFCYLLAPPMSTLTDEARKRLRAIEEFADLGSGFNIAMRDLDIRGAGNILGAEQSGFISEIGFDMYHKILDEAIAELKEEEFADLFRGDAREEKLKDCVIETDLEILIPDHYVSQITERLRLYKELDAINTEEELQRFREQLVDRFGPVPSQTEALFQAIRLRWLAARTGFEKLNLKKQRLIAYLPENQESPFFQSDQFAHILETIKNHPSACRLKQENDRLSLVFSDIQSIDAAIERIGFFSLRHPSIKQS